MKLADGDQIIMSDAVRRELDALPPHVSLRALGEHYLRSVPEPLVVFQVLGPGLSDAPPRFLRWAPERAARPCPGSAETAGAGEAPLAPADAAGGEFPDLDLERLQLVTDWEPALEEELLGIFLESSRETLKDLRTAIEAGDARLLRAYAHALKGSSRTIGAIALGELAQELERLGDSSDFASACGALLSADAAFERMASAINAQRLPEAA
jgi:HPt (histidine-containing phosphotransfer) domain-containing protein